MSGRYRLGNDRLNCGKIVIFWKTVSEQYLQFQYQDMFFELSGAQLQQLRINQQAVSSDYSQQPHIQHQFAYMQQDWQIQLHFDPQQQAVILKLNQQDTLLFEQAYPVQVQSGHQQESSKFSKIGLLGLGFKLFKSAKVIQVALVGASAASYAYLFTWQFALILIMALMFHELGHLHALKKMGL